MPSPLPRGFLAPLLSSFKTMKVTLPKLRRRRMALSGLAVAAPTICILCIVVILVPRIRAQRSPASFEENFVVTWSPSNVKFLDGGQQLQLSLDQSSGSGFASKNKYLFGNIDMQIKLVPGDSAGTVTAYYLSSQTANHDELDFEFLGNVSGEPYILQTNVYASGVGSREQRIYLWFDPTADFHTYSVSWGTEYIVFMVDGTPVRVFPNRESLGVPYLNKQAMGIFSSLWNGDSWATRGGLVKINWSHAPFVATYQGFWTNACVATSSVEACTSTIGAKGAGVATLSTSLVSKLEWVQKNYLVYDYCSDTSRYPTPPPECALF